jgi:hypothetical protein
MLQNNKNTFPKQTKFTFVNPGFSDFPDILRLLNEGKKINLVFEKELYRNDFSQSTNLFPFRVTDFPRNFFEWGILQKTINFAPHLLLSQKVFYPGEQLFLKTKAMFADILYKNRYHQKVQFFSPKQNESFGFLNQKTLNGFFFQEYKLNISRLFIELLQYVHHRGGEINVQNNYNLSNSGNNSENIKYCTPESTTVYRISAETYTDFVMQVCYHKNRVYFYEKNKMLEMQITRQTNKTIERKEVEQLITNYFHIKQPVLTKENIPLKLTVKVLDKIVSQLQSQLPGTFNEVKYENMFELCRVKFDIAKQTGIGFPEFKILFHRYGKNIDPIIDKAYEKMDETRDPLKIWAFAEDWFQKENEWKN